MTPNNNQRALNEAVKAIASVIGLMTAIFALLGVFLPTGLVQPIGALVIGLVLTAILAWMGKLDWEKALVTWLTVSIVLIIVHLIVSRPATIVGSVVDSSGSPAVGLTLVLTDSSGVDHKAVTGENGAFEIKGVPEGKFNVSANGELLIGGRVPSGWKRIVDSKIEAGTLAHKPASAVVAAVPPDTPTPTAEVLPSTVQGPIKIGHVAPLTGDISEVGKGAKDALEMWLQDIEAAGGLVVGNKVHDVEVIHEDNESKSEFATAVATRLIVEDGVLAIIGSYASKQAIPTGEVADANETPMVSPWSTYPETTKDRPWVFRACFLDPVQGSVIANFATEEFGATKASVLYNATSNYPKEVAESFRSTFEDIHGEGSVVAFETFTTKDRDFSAQLTKIKDSDADFLFTPQYYDEVPLIVQQAHELGWDRPILGSDSWGTVELMPLCGEDCVGSYFSTHYAAAGAKGATKEFIDRYIEKYGYVPNDVPALTWDTALIVQKAIEDCGNITGDLVKDRKCVRDALAKIKDFDGITGRLTFKEEGDPIKCAVIVRINEDYEFEFYKSVCP